MTRNIVFFIWILLGLFLLFASYTHAWMATSGEGQYGLDYKNSHQLLAFKLSKISLLILYSAIIYKITGNQEKRMKDLKSKNLIVLKGFSFLVIVIFSSWLLLLEKEMILKIILLMLDLWAFARLYYFTFYVLENYINKDYKYSGIFDQLKVILKLKSPNK